MDDFARFCSEMGDIKPINKANNTVLHKKSPIDERSRNERYRAATCGMGSSEHALTFDDIEMVNPDDPICYKKDGVQEGVYRNLRLGKYEIHSVLNLHGKTVQEAASTLISFIDDCQKANIRSILIQHGKGVKSQPNKAILKSYLNRWLTQMDPVLAFHSAQPHHGGYGAAYVLLKKSEEARLMNKERHQKRGAN